MTEDDVSNFRISFSTTSPHFPVLHWSSMFSSQGYHWPICNQLLVVIDIAAHACFPKILPRKVCRVPGWNDKAKSFRQKAIFWDRIWKECGCPSSGVLSTLKKSTKSRVHRLNIDKLITSGVRNWLGLGAIQVTMILGTYFVRIVVKANFLAVTNWWYHHWWIYPLRSLRYSILILTNLIRVVSLLTSLIPFQALTCYLQSSTVVLNALDQLKKGKSDGSSLLSDVYYMPKIFLATLWVNILRKCRLMNAINDLKCHMVHSNVQPPQVRYCPHCSTNTDKLLN